MLTGRRTVPPEDRLSALDVTNLIVEAHGVPMHVGALALLDGGPLLDPATGELRLDAVREHVAARLPRRMRQRLVVPPHGRGFHHWAPPGDVDLDQHVRTTVLPAPGDESALLEACAAIHAEPLDRERPLWQMWLLTGLADGRVGLLVRLHHVIADGLAALALMGSMFEPATLPAPGPATAEPAESARAVAERAGADASRAGADASRARAVVSRAGAAASRVAQAVSLLRAGPAPAVSFNRPVRGRTRLALVRADTSRTKAVAHAHGGKVNDVVLSAVAGGARGLLAGRGELVPDLRLRVSVIVSLRPADSAASGNLSSPASGHFGSTASGNLTGVRVSEVPVGEPDPVRALERIAARSAVDRSRPPMMTGGRLLRRWTVRVMDRQRMVNLIVSNLPGPPARLRFAGADVLELFQIGLNQGNLALGVGVLSYAGQLNFGVFADTAVVPDLAAFVAGLTRTLDQLEAR